MHCPSCGAEAPLTQRFCRSCGFSLEKIPELVTQQLAEPANEKLRERQLKIEHWLSVSGIGFVALLVLSALTGLIYLILAGNIPLLPGMILLTAVLAGLVAGSLGLYSENLKRRLSGRTSLESNTLGEKTTTAKLSLEAYQEPSMSVTERTTTLLGKNESTKKHHQS